MEFDYSRVAAFRQKQDPALSNHHRASGRYQPLPFAGSSLFLIYEMTFGNGFTIVLLFPVIISATAGTYKTSVDELKPCFERYIGQRLTDLAPYHSEWRMKTPEECLLFCALSSSRCRSIVYDVFQHICFYFLDDGQHHARLARGMVYLRVTEKECLDQFLSTASPALLDAGPGIPEVASTTPEFGTAAGFIEVKRPVLAYANSLIHVPPDGRAIIPVIPFFDGPQNLKKYGNFDETELIVTIVPTVSSTNTTAVPTSQSTTASTLSAATTIFSKVLHEEGERGHKIYDEVIEMASPSEITITAASSNRSQPNPAASSSGAASFFVGNAAGSSGGNPHGSAVSNGDDLGKLLKPFPDDIRRSPLKTTLAAAEKLNEGADGLEISDKGKSFAVDKPMPIPAIKSISITLSKHDNKMEKLLSPACGSDERDVWVAVENAILQSDRPQKETSAESYYSCKTKCNLITNAGRDCISFTYYEVERLCLIHTNNAEAVSSLTLLPSPKADFNVRTATKFCYPESLVIFEQCPEFIAFRDYTLDVEPREIFDDMPRGREGLHACIELCVLTPTFHCKSATFDTLAGKCFLLDEDSLTSPDYFREHRHYGLIYFENGCEQIDNERIPKEAQVERVTIEQPDEVQQLQYRQISGEAFIEN